MLATGRSWEGTRGILRVLEMQPEYVVCSNGAVIMKRIAGDFGDEVRYGGLLVGQVTKLDLSEEDPTQIVVTFRVRRKTPMRTDTKASITQVGFLGAPYLNLTPGRSDALPLPPGSRVASVDQMKGLRNTLLSVCRAVSRAPSALRVSTRIEKRLASGISVAITTATSATPCAP